MSSVLPKKRTDASFFRARLNVVRNCHQIKSFVASLSSHERFYFQAVGYYRSLFDKRGVNSKSFT